VSKPKSARPGSRSGINWRASWQWQQDRTAGESSRAARDERSRRAEAERRVDTLMRDTPPGSIAMRMFGRVVR
jgi:hypothetical protein